MSASFAFVIALLLTVHAVPEPETVMSPLLPSVMRPVFRRRRIEALTAATCRGVQPSLGRPGYPVGAVIASPAERHRCCRCLGGTLRHGRPAWRAACGRSGR